MSAFCLQCTQNMFPEDFKVDLAGLCKEGQFINEICDGCAGRVFDHTGKCVDKYCHDHSQSKSLCILLHNTVVLGDHVISVRLCPVHPWEEARAITLNFRRQKAGPFSSAMYLIDMPDQSHLFIPEKDGKPDWNAAFDPMPKGFYNIVVSCDERDLKNWVRP